MTPMFSVLPVAAGAEVGAALAELATGVLAVATAEGAVEADELVAGELDVVLVVLFDELHAATVTATVSALARASPLRLRVPDGLTRTPLLAEDSHGRAVRI